MFIFMVLPQQQLTDTLTAKVFLRHYEGRQIVDLNKHDIRDFLKFLMNDKKLLPATINNCNGVIRFIYSPSSFSPSDISYV